MDYKYTPKRENYAPYAAGGVFYAAPGHTAFPVRLAVEILRRCLAIRRTEGATGPAVVYDPCCGGAYHLATMAWFNWGDIQSIYASDLDADALGIAARNLALLALAGMDRRVAALADLHRQFGKASHAASLAHAQMLRQRLEELDRNHPIATHLFCADAANGRAVADGLAGAKADIVLIDIPYGQLSHWQGAAATPAQGADPTQQLLDALLPVLGERAAVAVAAAKGDKISHEDYRRLERLTVGKRQIVILQSIKR